MIDDVNRVPVIGPIGPRADGLDKPFWDGLDAGKLQLQCCEQCETWLWGPVWRCGNCGSWNIAWRETAMRGRVFSWVKTHKAFSAVMESVVPFVTLQVELPEAGMRRLFGILVGPEEGLEIGAPVEGVIQIPSALTHGQPVLRWKLAG